jgi:hypothetical protein
MTEIRFVNVNRVQVAPPVRTRKKRLDLIVAAHAARYGGGERVLVSVHRLGDIMAPTSDSIYFPSIPDEVEFHEREAFAERLYSTRRVEKGEIVLITVTPAGGGRGGGAKIGLTIATLALAAFAFWAGPAVAGALNLAKDGIVAKIVTAGIVIGGGAVLSAVMRSGQKDSKIYGVTGGGNVPRPNDRIPFGYGVYWNPADAAQPDYYRYQNETDTILFKRVVLGAGKYKLKEIRVGTTTFWTGDLAPNGGVTTSGITSPFPGCKFELLYGQASTLVPSTVITSPNVTGQTIPLSSDVNPVLGPFAVNPVGTTINRIQVDYSTPSGYSRNNHETPQDLHFEYAPIDDAGTPTGSWQTLYRATGNFFTTKSLRWSQFVTVPEGRYAVRARNNRAKIDDGDNCEYAWDALRGYTPDTIVRENITEVAMEIRSSKDLGVTSFSDVQFRQERVGPVFNGTTFAEGPIRKCVDAYADLMRDANFGGGISDELIDYGRILSYRSAVPEFDTFDGQIRGPTSLWEAAKTILANMRAEPIQIGAGFSFVRDEPQAIRRHTFTRRQIARGSLSMDFAVEADDGSAHVEVAFSTDADPKQPNGAEAFYGLPSIFGPRRIEWQGVSSYEHATHLARWMSASGFYRRSTINFETELAGRMVKRGDAIAVDPWFVDSRAVAGVLSAAGNTLTLDVDVTVAAGDRAMLRDREGREWGPVRVTQGAGPRLVVLNSDDVTAEAADTGLALSAVLAASGAQPTAIIIGPLADLGEQWLVQSMQPAEKGRTRITAKMDSPLVYDAIGAEITPQDPLSWTLTPVEAPEVTSLRANVVQHTSGLMVQWSIAAQVGAVRYEVQIAYGDDEGAWEAVYTGPGASGEAPIRYLTTEEPVFVRARAFGETGLTGGWETSSGIVAPKPIIIATEVEDGTIDLDALDDAVKETLDKVDVTEQDVRDLIKSLSPNSLTRAEVKGKFDNALHDAVRNLGLSLGYALARIEQTSGTLRDAGISVDPVAGTIRIEAVDRLRTSTTTQFSEVSALFDAVNALISLRATKAELDAAIEAVVAGFQPAYRYEFNGTNEGWTGSNATLTAGSGSTVIAGTGASAYAASPTLSLDADTNKVVAIRVRRTAGTGWGLALQWGASYADSRAFAEPAVPGDWQILRLDQTGQTGWTGTLTGLRLTVANGSSFEVDYIEIGNSALNDLIVGELSARVSDLEIELDAANAAILLRATLADLGAAEDRITVAELAIDAAEAAISGKVSNTVFEGVEARVTTAEFKLDALENQISFSIGALQDKSPLIKDLALADARGQIDAFLRNQTVDQALAYARQVLGARIDENGAAIATFGLALIALTDSTAAQFTDEATVRAAADSALSARATTLEAALNDPTTGLITRMATAETLIATKVDDDGATAIATTVLEAMFGGGTAGVKMRLATLAAPSGYDALFQIEASVTGADGTYKATGMQIAVLTVGGVQVGLIEFVADRLRIKRPSDGATVLGWDSDEEVLSIFGGTYVGGAFRSDNGRLVIDGGDEPLITFKNTSGAPVLLLGYY